MFSLKVFSLVIFLHLFFSIWPTLIFQDPTNCGKNLDLTLSLMIAYGKRYSNLFYFITEAEFLAIAEKLKPHVERRMKIEPFPWLRDYYVDMNKLYTELILEKIENEVLGENTWPLKDYKEMFDSKSRHKILIKGDPGMGKTTLGKKIGWDWARGDMKIFSTVFFIFLKFVKRGEQIENVILKQNPELEGLGVSPKKLRAVLHRFSDRCLLILDGLDEHALGQNEDVLKIIQDQKLLDCGIIVSSRPHSTKEVEADFSTVIRVDGFNRKAAEKFISNFVTNQNKIDEIMKFNPSDLRKELPIYQKSPIQQCPILLSFFCFLVTEQEIDLSDKTVTMGDIYTRLVKCLYKKYTIRKGIKFELDHFVQVLKSVGILALTTLKSNNPLLEKSEVLSTVGNDAFEYGFFAGHEDFRLSGDLTADIYVTYAHRSLEEFFGSFGFCQALSEGKRLEEILGFNSQSSLLLVNPLFLKFSLWFLSSPDFNFQQSEDCYDKITSYVATHIDSVEFDVMKTSKKYPAFDVQSLNTRPDGLERRFCRDTFEKCKSVKTLNIPLFGFIPLYSRIVDTVLKLMNKDFLNNLTKIIVGVPEPRDTDDSALTLAVNAGYFESLKLLHLLLQDYNLTRRNPQVYLRLRYINFPDKKSDVIGLITKEVKDLHKYIKELDVQFQIRFTRLHLEASGKFPHCPAFRHLVVERGHIDGSVPSALREALRHGKLPSFTSVDLVSCCGHTSDTDWPKEVKLNVYNSSYIPYEPCPLCSH